MVKKQVTYSAIIRTLGTGGEKYQRLLDSLKSQTQPPEHIYVVMAHGYDLPPQRIGTEEFVYTDKGMWHQRIFGLQYADANCSSDYYLLLDDDIEFKPDFGERAMSFLSETGADLMSPQSLTADWTVPAPTRRLSLSNIANIALGRRIESRKEDFRTTITCTGGLRQNTAHRRNAIANQSGNGQAFFMKRESATKLHFEDEYWLDEGTYALPEDQVFFYKAYLYGLDIIFNRETGYRHLDNGSDSPGRKAKSAFAQGRNFLIFWHRFVYSPQKNDTGRSLVNMAGIVYRISASSVAYLLTDLTNLNLICIKSYIRGLADGISCLKGCKYKNLRPVSDKVHQ